ncbi:MAG: aspartate carbamoyltransferase [Spirochaetota bacterium]
MSGSPFLGRTIQIVRDLSVDEQIYLYDQTRRLKEALRSGDPASIGRFRVDRPDLSVYLLFLEDSTRTKESFRNAAKFHQVKLNDFAAGASSFSKKESLTDTIKMLVGYSEQSVFVLRTKTEGTCRWLEEAVGAYTQKAGLPPAAFINGGDGRHEHPTQEFLDEFSFLEQNGWDRSHIHLALIGDLFHGRTVHSKVDGLQIFGEVEVDLVAPDEIAMPAHYVERMRRLGFQVRTFESIEEYLADPRVAPVWYFTRLQLERMGDQLLDKAPRLRRAVTFRREFLDRIDERTRFYHPLPRHQVTPTIPSFLDETPLNGWERQSMNGYYTRIIELAMVSGHLGSEFTGRARVRQEYPDDFVHLVEASASRKPEYKVGIKPVTSGLVIDHIGRGSAPEVIWDQIDKIRRILRLNRVSSHGVYRSTASHDHKGIISVPDLLELSDPEIKMLGASAPGSTLNVVRDGQVVRKYRMGMPPRVYSLPGISCKNEECISHPSHHEPVSPEFLRAGENTYTCKYCEKPHIFGEIW